MEKRRVRKPDERDGWYEFVPVTAQADLDAGAKNRPRNEFRAERIAADISAGHWRENGETLVYDETGRLMDGQTRLRACILANKPLVSYCVFGVPYVVFPSLDTGRSRSGGDIAGLLGFKNCHAIAAVARLIIRYQRGVLTTTGSSTIIPNEEIKSYLKRNRERLSAAMEFVQKRRGGIVGLLPISQVAFVFYMNAEKHRSKAEEFVEKLATGAELAQQSPILILRRRMEGLRGEKHLLTEPQKLALVIKAWNAFLAGKSTSLLKWNAEVETFPKFSGEAGA
jgi:hypothetical protein